MMRSSTQIGCAIAVTSMDACSVMLRCLRLRLWQPKWLSRGVPRFERQAVAWNDGSLPVSAGVYLDLRASIAIVGCNGGLDA